MMEDSMRKRRCTYIKHHIYIKNWVIMLYSRNWHSYKSTIIKINLKKRIEVLPFSFFFLAMPLHVEVPGPGTEPTPLQWKCQVFNLLYPRELWGSCLLKQNKHFWTSKAWSQDSFDQLCSWSFVYSSFTELLHFITKI